MDNQPDEILYEPILEECRTYIQHYDELENWLLSIQRSGFDEESIARVRAVAQKGRLSAITDQVIEELSAQQDNRTDPLSPVLKILTELDLEKEFVYDSVLLVCNTADPKNLEPALATVRYCQSRAEQALRMVPEIVARHRRAAAAEARRHAARQAAFKWGVASAVIGGILGAGLDVPYVLLFAVTGFVLGAGISYRIIEHIRED